MHVEGRTPSPDQSADPSCLELLDQAVGDRKGIVNVALDTADETITFAYDPQRVAEDDIPVSYTHLRAHETVLDLVCRLLLEKQNQINK